MSNYTEADVEQWTKKLVKLVDFEPTELTALHDAALEGAKVPGLVADNAALLAVARLVSGEWMMHRALSPETVEALRREVSWVENGDKHRGAALLAEHEAKVSALHARVAELERERDAARRWEETHRKASQVWEDMFNTTLSERDALRAQVLQAQDAAYAQSFTIWVDAVRARQVADAVGTALSAPPAETKKETCGMARYVQHDVGPDHRITPPCSFAPTHSGGHSWESPAETAPATDRCPCGHPPDRHWDVGCVDCTCMRSK